MLVRWFTEFLVGTKRQARKLWSQEKSQTTWQDCSSRKTTRSWLTAQAQDLMEKRPELCPSSTALTPGWVSAGEPCPALRPGLAGENKLPGLHSGCKGI